jgi:hypothetical protein
MAEKTAAVPETVYPPVVGGALVAITPVGLGIDLQR